MSTKPLPLGFLSRELVNQRTTLYLNGVHKTNSDALTEKHGKKTEDTRWVWYSKQQIEEWLSELTDFQGNGIRIYIGQKEDNNLEGGIPEHTTPYEPLPGQLCLMFVLTKPANPEEDPEAHPNIVYEEASDFQIRKELLEQNRNRSINAGTYSPPLRTYLQDEYPNNSLT